MEKSEENKLDLSMSIATHFVQHVNEEVALN